MTQHVNFDDKKDANFPKGLTERMSPVRHDKWEDIKDMPSPRRISHLSITTNENYEQMLNWYKVVFDATLVNGIAGVMEFLTFGNEHHRFAIVKEPSLQAKPLGRDPRGNIGPAVVGLTHAAFSYASLAELLFAYQRIKEAGITPSYCQNRGLTTSIYYYDPDYNEIELMVDNFDTTEECYLYKRDHQAKAGGLHSYDGNFDPDKMLELLKSGVPDHDLKDRNKLIELNKAGKI